MVVAICHVLSMCQVLISRNKYNFHDSIIEAQRGQATHPRLHSWKRPEPGFQQGPASDPKVCAYNHYTMLPPLLLSSQWDAFLFTYSFSQSTDVWCAMRQRQVWNHMIKTSGLELKELPDLWDGHMEVIDHISVTGSVAVHLSFGGTHLSPPWERW